ncbi:tetratricopeptide repeat protein [Nostoc ellipsosporum NOK]|nr:tetratricopeptide repeat protein [Nostoc ellipsosporum NOK]
MQSCKILALLTTLSLVIMPQMSFAQIVELVEQAQTAQQEENYKEAEILWRRVIQKEPNDATAYVRLGYALFFQDKTEAAIAAYQKALKLQPSAAIYIDFAEWLVIKEKPAEAMAAYRQAIKLNPKNDNPHKGIGDTLMAQEKYPQAIAEYRQAVALNANGSNYQALADALSQAEKTQEAIAAYRQAIKFEPKEYLYYTSLADILPLKQGITTFGELTQVDPKNDVPYQALGYFWKKHENLDQAIVAYRQGIQVKPSVFSYWLLGEALMEQEKITEAIAAYRQAIAMKPGDTEYSSLATALLKQEKLNEALDACRQVIYLNDGDYSTCAVAGLGLYEKQGFSAVKNFYSQFTTDIQPEDMAKLYVSLGNGIKWQLDGEKQDTVAAFQQALKFNPGDQSALEGLKELQQEASDN